MQQFMPTWTTFHEAKFLVVLTAFLCLSVTVPLPVVFLLATVCGFLWDAQTVLLADPINAEIGHRAVQAPRFGTSIILFGFCGAIMNGIRPLFRSGKWYLAVILLAITSFLFLMSEYAVIDFVRNTFSIDRTVLSKSAATSAICAAISPAFFLLLKLISHITRYRIFEEPHTRRRTS